jgi:predicted N-acetyltransferase YhbS
MRFPNHQASLHAVTPRARLTLVRYCIRSARRKDLPAVHDLLGICFTTPREYFVNQTEHDATYRLGQTRIVEIGGRIVSHVRIFHRQMLLRGVALPVGGIGSVATHPDYRRHGFATALLRDAIEQMERAGYALSFLWTGLAPFYERLGWRVALQPIYTARPEEAARLSAAATVSVRPLTSADLPVVARIYRRAAEGSTGAIVRTLRYWRDHMTWVDDDPEGFLVAERRGHVVAYVRSRAEVGNHLRLLEGEALPGAESALKALVAELGRLAVRRRLTSMLGIIPPGHPLSQVLESLPSTYVATNTALPTMIRPISQEGEAVFSAGETFRFWHSDLI